MGNVLGVIHGDEAVTFIIFKMRYDEGRKTGRGKQTWRYYK